MPEGGFLEQKPRSPTGLTIVIVLHAVAIGALALAKMDMPVKVFTPLIVKEYPEPTVPPEVPPEPKLKEKLREPPKSRVDNVPPPMPLPPNNSGVVLEPEPNLTIFEPLSSGTAETNKPADPPAPIPVPDPVRTEAQIDGRSSLQPDYPAAEQRAENEGSATVTVVIGTDGRVKSVIKVRAASEAFWRTTERHALRHWRFKPATVDGKPVESRKTMTVHFRLDA